MALSRSGHQHRRRDGFETSLRGSLLRKRTRPRQTKEQPSGHFQPRIPPDRGDTACVCMLCVPLYLSLSCPAGGCLCLAAYPSAVCLRHRPPPNVSFALVLVCGGLGDGEAEKKKKLFVDRHRRRRSRTGTTLLVLLLLFLLSLLLEAEALGGSTAHIICIYVRTRIYLKRSSAFEIVQILPRREFLSVCINVQHYYVYLYLCSLYMYLSLSASPSYSQSADLD